MKDTTLLEMKMRGRRFMSFLLSCDYGLNKQFFFVFFALLLISLLLWAHSRDPFRRIEFIVKTPTGNKVHGVTILPAGFKNGSVIVYVHGSGGSWLTDGNNLRQFAELGMAAVGFDYDQVNDKSFESEFATVLDYVRQQSWAQTNAMAWVSFSLGGQNTLRYLLRHPQEQPQVYVRLAGGWIPELNELSLKDSKTKVAAFNCAFLLVHGEHDEIFPVNDAKRLARLLNTNGSSVELRVLGGHGHAFESDQPVVFRLVSEFCRARLTTSHFSPQFPKLNSYSFLFYVSPALFWAIFWAHRQKKASGQTATGMSDSFALRLTCREVTIRTIAAVFGTLALADTALHLIPPRMEISPRNLDIARKHLLSPNWRQDFEILAASPIWNGQNLKTLLTHVELAHYTVYELINWKLETSVYQQFVLSPVITGADRELNWRRELWESFYPCVRHEKSTSDAADIVVRFMRQRITIAPKCPQQLGVESMWNGHIVNPSDFEVLYVAALRSVGVPARLDASHQAELWTGQGWREAPRPLAATWVE